MIKMIIFIIFIIFITGIISKFIAKSDVPVLTTNYIYFTQDKQLTKNFKLSELWDKGYVIIPNVYILAKWLQSLRSAFLKAIVIISATRIPEHNKLIDGAIKSWHLFSLAVDILIHNDIEKYQLEGLAIRLGWGGIGIGIKGKNQLHIDLRNLFNQSARWIYD